MVKQYGFRIPALLALCLLSAVPATAQETVPEPDLMLSLVPVDTLALPVAGRVAGLAWVGPDTLAVLDAVPDSVSEDHRPHMRLVIGDRDGTVFETRDFTGLLTAGLAWDGESFWSTGPQEEGRSLLYRVSGDSLLVKDAYDLPGHRPVGIAFDGRYLWVTDRDSGHLDRFDPRTEAVTRTVYGPGFSPCGIAHDGRHTWLTDAGTGMMYRLSGGRRSWSATVTPETFMHRGEEILLGHDGFSLFYVPDGEHFALRVVFQ